MHRLRVLVVGDPPPFVQEVRDGARREIPPPAGSIPPRVVTVPQADEVDRAPLRIRLGQSSPPVMLPFPRDGRIEVKSEAGAKWLDLPLHPGGASLALVRRGGAILLLSGLEVVNRGIPEPTPAPTAGFFRCAV